MATPAEVLLSKSPLLSGTPAEHLLAIIVGGGGGGSDPLVGVLVSPPSLQGVLGGASVLQGALVLPGALVASLAPPGALAGSLVQPTSLVGTIECNGEIVTDFSIPYGRSFTTPLNFFESDGTTPLDCTGAVVEWWVNDAPADGISDSTEIVKRSYDAAEIATVDESLGQYTLRVRASDNELPALDHYHCAVLTRRGSVSTTAGTVSVTAGDGTIVGAGIDTGAIFDGDLLVINGGANDGKTVIVRHARDANGVPTGDLVTSFTAWTTQSGASFTVYEADKPIVSGVDGTYTILPC